jgi:iron complex outermembrane receptor protein
MSNKNKWRLWLSGASMAAIGAVTPAQAQDVSDEIVVTATGRAAAIQDVPLAVQAIPSEQLEQAGVQSIADLNQLAPTLRIGAGQSTTSGTLISIRGISTGSDNPGFEGAVGVFIDGVYRARAGAALGDLPDVERIEILRGPQGTLFGKNTSAGALSVVTAGPSHDLGVWGELEAAERGGARTSFGATTGVTDNLAVRFDGALRGQDGYIDDVTSGRDINDTNRWNARAQALWDITPDASLRVIADGGRVRENCCGAVNLQTGTIVGGLVDQYFAGSILDVSPEERQMTVSPARSYSENADDFGVSGQLDWAIGDINLTSITAYRNWTSQRAQDIDFTSIDRAYRDGLRIGINSISEELRLQGEHGRLNWLVGGFISRENLKTTDNIRFGADATAYGNAVYEYLTSIPLLDINDDGTPETTFAQALSFGSQDSFRAYATDTSGEGNPCFFAYNSPLVPGPGGACLPDLTDGDGQQADFWRTETETASLFTHNEISLTDSLILTVGARFNHETKELDANLASVNAGCDSLRGENFDVALATRNLAASLDAETGVDTLMAIACNAVTNTLANGEWSDEREENEWSGTASLAYHVNDDLMVYGGYSRGYKAGGFNLDRSGFFGANNLTPLFGAGVGEDLDVNDLEFEPEFTDALELGLKSTIFGGTTYFNANVFYQEIHDYQQNAFSGFNFFTLNVPELISRGVELEFNASPTDNLTLTGGVVYNEAYYDSSATYGDQTIASGTVLSQAPEWTVTGSANYRIPLGAHYLNLFATGRYVSEYTTQTLSRNPITDNDAFAIFDARISFGPEDERWSVEAFARNLTDEFYYVSGFGAPERTLPEVVDPDMSGSNYLIYPNTPRTVGIMIRARY